MAESSSRTGKRTIIELIVGLFLGFLSASLGGPAVISWWYKPPSQDAFSCASSVEQALSQFLQFQLICAALGGVAVLLASIGLRRLFRRRQARDIPS
jgi:hypothetical protein